jgi:chromate reductase, NAD(P)H dehydrogenase (quinone)
MNHHSHRGLDILVFLGSVRISTPPRPPRLGERLARFCVAELVSRDHKVNLVDPMEIALDPVFKPHFAYKQGEAPDDLELLAQSIDAADAYVMISPEYNHSMSPALAHLLNHFGSSLFSYKPSAVVTYSAGQWGGARAAVVMRTFLSELGCLPVSAMIQVPKAADVFTEGGGFCEDTDENDWRKYCGRTWAQLEWWGEAAKNQRRSIDPNAVIKPFLSTPSQRNAPTTNRDG